MRQAAAAGDQGGAVGQAEGGQREGRPAEDPEHGLVPQATHGELAPDAADHDGHEGGEAQLVQGGAAQGEGPVDGGQEDVTGVGRLDGQRPTAGPGAQADEDGQGHAHTDDVGTVMEDLRRSQRSEALAADPAGEQEHGGQGHQGGQVHLVEGVDPVDVGHPLAPSGRPQIGQRRGGVGGTDGALRHGWSAYDRPRPVRWSRHLRTQLIRPASSTAMRSP